MAERQLCKVLRVVKLTQGSNLADAWTVASPADGENRKVEAITDFDPDGGIAIIEPGTASSEKIRYRSINETTDELVGITRTSRKAHTRGVFIQEGEEPTIEKWAEGKLDDEEELSFFPVPASLYALLRLGTYEDETAPAIVITYDDDLDQLIVGEGPVGAVPSFDEDVEVLPPVGGGNTAGATTNPDTGKVLPPKGMGFEDGGPPSSSPTPVVTGGLGNTLFVRFETIANSSIVQYEIHAHTATGFAPSDATRVDVLSLAGTAGFEAVAGFRDFPAGHVLDGAASDPPQPGTTYFVKIVAKDGSGAAAASAQASGTPIKVATADIIAGAITADLIAAAAITSTKIEDGAISTPKLAAGAVTAVKITAGAITANEIAAGTITGDRIAGNTITGGLIAGTTITGDKISGSTITADKLSVSSLSAISANIGNITAGSITGVTITGVTVTGSTLTTATSGGRVEIGTGGVAQQIQFFNTTSGAFAGSVKTGSSGSGITIDSPNDIVIGTTTTDFIRLQTQGGDVLVEAPASLALANPLKYTDTNDTASNPGVGAGVGQALPGAPAVWFKIVTPAGGTRWIPTW